MGGRTNRQGDTLLCWFFLTSTPAWGFNYLNLNGVQRDMKVNHCSQGYIQIKSEEA